MVRSILGKPVVNRLIASAVGAAVLSLGSAAGAAEVYNEPLTTPAQDDVDGFKSADPGAIPSLDHFYQLASSLPEPMTWVMMIMGFGSAGAILRRRKALGEFD